MRFVMVLAVAVAAQLTARFCRRSVAASRESERGTAVPRTFLPLPARVRRRAAIRDPFPLSRGRRKRWVTGTGTERPTPSGALLATPGVAITHFD